MGMRELTGGRGLEGNLPKLADRTEEAIAMLIKSNRDYFYRCAFDLSKQHFAPVKCPPELSPLVEARCAVLGLPMPRFTFLSRSSFRITFESDGVQKDFKFMGTGACATAATKAGPVIEMDQPPMEKAFLESWKPVLWELEAYKPFRALRLDAEEDPGKWGFTCPAATRSKANDVVKPSESNNDTSTSQPGH